jgi:Protein of unknown function (DUF3631)
MSKKSSDYGKSLNIDEMLNVNDSSPYTGEVEGGVLLKELYDCIREYVVLDECYGVALTLWIVQTYCYKNFSYAPLLLINAPEKACGKSVALGLVAKLVPRPLECANITVASLFRVIESKYPTLLIDEADTFLEGKTELTGILNSGYEARGAVLRTEQVGDRFEVVAYKVFGPKALAGIALDRHLPDATLSRAIHVGMRRKVKGESVSRLRSFDSARSSNLRSRIKKFVFDNREILKPNMIELPETLSDREQDNWDPLFSIAASAGENWLTRAKKAALAIKGATEEPQSLSNNLLHDVREVLTDFNADRISTKDLLELLTEDEDMAWVNYNRGNSLTARQLATFLKNYGVQPKTVRMPNGSTPKGYSVRDFDDAFVRYLKPLDVQVDETGDGSAVERSTASSVAPVVLKLEAVETMFLATDSEKVKVNVQDVCTTSDGVDFHHEDADF